MRSLELPCPAQNVQGVYQYIVGEAPFLASLRVQAFTQAGQTGTFSGSASDYRNLSAGAREAMDPILSQLVEEFRQELEDRSSRENLVEDFVSPVCNNLILDQGLNNVMQTVNWASFSIYCAAGVGTTPTFTDSGAVTGTSTGTTVTASVSFFTADMVGQLIKFDTGEERYITAQAGTTATINTALEVAAPTLFTVWAVNQVSLASESKRTNTYLTGAGNTQVSGALNVYTYKRTYDFTVEGAPVNYSELGWSHSNVAGANINSRTLISGGTVTVLLGQQLRVVYSLNVTVGPVVATAGSWDITGWTDTVGQYIFANPGASTAYPYYDTNGAIQSNGSWPMTTSGTRHHLATGSVLPIFGNSYSPGTAVQGTTISLDSYVANSFTRTASSNWAVGVGNRADWRGIYVPDAQGLIFVFDTAKEKDSLHTLLVRSRMTVGRTLTNP